MKCGLTDAVVGYHSVSIVTLLSIGGLHNPIPTVPFIIRCVFHGLER